MLLLPRVCWKHPVRTTAGGGFDRAWETQPAVRDVQGAWLCPARTCQVLCPLSAPDSTPRACRTPSAATAGPTPGRSILRADRERGTLEYPRAAPIPHQNRSDPCTDPCAYPSAAGGARFCKRGLRRAPARSVRAPPPFPAPRYRANAAALPAAPAPRSPPQRGGQRPAPPPMGLPGPSPPPPSPPVPASPPAAGTDQPLCPRQEPRRGAQVRERMQ